MAYRFLTMAYFPMDPWLRCRRDYMFEVEGMRVEKLGYDMKARWYGNRYKTAETILLSRKKSLGLP